MPFTIIDQAPAVTHHQAVSQSSSEVTVALITLDTALKAARAQRMPTSVAPVGYTTCSDVDLWKHLGIWGSRYLQKIGIKHGEITEGLMFF